MIKVTALTAAAILVASTLFAQAPAGAAAAAATPSSSQQALNEWVSLALDAAKIPNLQEPFGSTLGHGGGSSLIAYLIATRSEGASAPEPYKALVKAMEARAVKQVGSTPSSTGTTSLAMKGRVPEILGVALETGAITRDVDGTSLTFRTTPASLVKALQKTGLDAIYEDYAKSSAARFASRFSVAASFDASLGPSAGTFTADKHQLTGWSLRAEILNQRDPKSPSYGPAFRKLLSDEYAKAAAEVNNALGGDPAFQTWEDQLKVKTKPIDAELKANASSATAAAAAAGKFRALLVASLPEFVKIVQQKPALLKTVDDYVASLQGIQDGLDDIYDFVDRGSLITFDWSTTRDETLPDLYALTVDWDAGIGRSRKTDLTVNAVVNFYTSKPSDSNQFKSFELAGQLDHALGSLGPLPPVTFTVAARYSYMPNDVLVAQGNTDAAPVTDIATSAAVAPKGNIGVVQAKLTIPVKGSGVKVPLSITASNRTELIKETDIRANFGITLDLDSVLSGLKLKP